MKGENKILLIFEKIGQVLVCCCALLFSDFNIHKWSGWSWWLIAAAFLLLGIYGKVIWMLIAIVVLGIGHIGIHFQHYRDLKIK